MRRLGSLLGAVLLAAACGGDSTPPPPYPALAGTFQITTSFPTATTPVTGTISFTQASRDTSTLIVTALTLKGTLPGFNIPTDGPAFAAVSTAGTVTLQLPTNGFIAVINFSGQLSSNGKTISGSVAASSIPKTVQGTFTMQKQ
jgi:hypothetical protein